MPMVVNNLFFTTELNNDVTSEDRRDGGCILCGAALESRVAGLFDTRFGIDGTYEVRSCGQCRLEQMFPVPKPAELKTLYETYYNFGGEKDTLYIRIREWLLSSVLYRVWIRLDGDISFHGRKGRGRLLDVGCNEGRSLRIYQRNGFRVEGLELNENAAAVAREAGFTVHTCDLSDFRTVDLYDVVVLSNVLEHSLDPRQMLLDIRRILKPGGQVWISCPNSQSWLRKTFGSYWINWHVPFHISHFSQKTSASVLKGSGFLTVETRQITPALWVSSSLIAALFAKKGRPTRQLRNPILVLGLLLVSRFVFFPVLWIGNRWGHGDCLLTVASVPRTHWAASTGSTLIVS
jgi:2-polyprenyl-3-methyl-5-hydroxy-6-metoxy-1,4-benzoquinol methylase